MTAFVHGKVRAHVMEWDGEKRLWSSVCPYYRTVVHPCDSKYDEPTSEWPLRHIGADDRLVPWCGWCVDVIRRRVERFTADVLLPAEVSS